MHLPTGKEKAYRGVSLLLSAHCHFQVNVGYWVLPYGKSVPCWTQELSNFFAFFYIFVTLKNNVITSPLFLCSMFQPYSQGSLLPS